MLLFGLLGPFAASFMNRFGVRRVVTIALLLIASGLLLSLRMTHLWQLMFTWGVVLGIGTGLTALVLAATVATRWFTARRGLVVGLLTASSATGQLVFLPLLASLTERYGWRSAMLFVVAMIALAAIAVMALMRDRPFDLGLAPLGETEPVPPPPVDRSFAGLFATPLKVLRDAARTRVFWILSATFFIAAPAPTGWCRRTSSRCAAITGSPR